MIGTVVIDSSSIQSDLCVLGRACGTDKSPYNTVAHRHPYTAVYSMLFERSAGITGSRVKYGLMDVEKDGDIRRALTGELYDVIIDDSSHNHGDQLRIINEAFPLLKSGGMLIIEDVFRSTPDEDYAKPLKDIIIRCSNAHFVLCEHKHRWSPGWDNDKLLVLVKA